MTHTKDLLADALDKIGYVKMAAKAREGYYHDYLSPLAMPAVQLANDLTELASTAREARAFDKMEEIMRLRTRVINGDFDATEEEANDWAQSPEGQETFAQLFRDDDK